MIAIFVANVLKQTAEAASKEQEDEALERKKLAADIWGALQDTVMQVPTSHHLNIIYFCVEA